MQNASDAFVAANVHLFAGAAASAADEQRLEWQNCYLQFAALYEAKLEEFVTSRGCSLEEFVAACRDALDNSSWAEHQGLATCILAMAEYPYFHSMMVTAAADASDGPAAYGEDARRGPVVLDDDEPAATDPGDALDGDFM